MSRPRGPLQPLPALRHVAWAVALALSTVAGAFLLGLGLSYLSEPFDLDRDGLLALGVMLGAALTGFGVLYVGFRRSCGWGPRELGFVAPSHSLWHLLWWIPLTVVVGATGASILGPLLGLSADPSSATADGVTLPPPLVAALVACVTLAVPLMEEIVFRRVLLDWLGRHLPMWMAAGIVILAFTVVHVSPAAMVYLIFTSTSLTLARLWFRTLTAPLVIHAVNNALVSLIVVLPG